jgi:hypothetical protein
MVESLARKSNRYGPVGGRAGQRIQLWFQIGVIVPDPRDVVARKEGRAKDEKRVNCERVVKSWMHHCFWTPRTKLKLVLGARGGQYMFCDPLFLVFDAFRDMEKDLLKHGEGEGSVSERRGVQDRHLSESQIERRGSAANNMRQTFERESNMIDDGTTVAIKISIC